ncbi:23S rRNA (uracil(1939)-C(5))-methyltransferase RlmD [Guggenheimella bovis]
MQKREIYEAEIVDSVFPLTGIAKVEGNDVYIQGTLPGDVVRFEYIKKKRERFIGELRALLNAPPSPCKHVTHCGGCKALHVSLEEQRKHKEREVLKLLRNQGVAIKRYLGISGIDQKLEYRNKMEYTFGDEEIDGELRLGLHKMHMSNSVFDTTGCRLVVDDFNKVVECTVGFFREGGYKRYHIMRQVGFLRNLIIRRSLKEQKLLVVLVTTSTDTFDEEAFVKELLRLKLENEIKGIVRIINDSKGETVQSDKEVVLYGEGKLDEELLGHTFHIRPLTFFQTNTLGASYLYSRVLSLLESQHTETIWDLYCGTGTITQLVSSKAKEAIGVDINESSIEAAKKSAEENGVTNVRFLAGDVRKVIDSIEGSADTILLDPPRSGLHPNVRKAIRESKAKTVLYVSCNPKTLAIDLKDLSHAFQIDHLELIDMFPNTSHVESAVLMSRKEK